jgi:hypothetical protein
MGETQALRRFLGPGVAQGESLAQPGDLANSVSLEPVALVLLGPFKCAIGGGGVAAVAAAAVAADVDMTTRSSVLRSAN